jgi:nucleotide-binding universal stress UspA family protein
METLRVGMEAREEVPMLKRILVAIDGSQPSLKAMAVAVGLAKRFGAKLHAVTVAHLPDYYLAHHAGAAPGVYASLREAAEEFAVRALEAAKDEARKEGMSVETYMEFGPVKDTLLDYVSKLKPDLLVVGNRGLSGLKRVWLGSVSESMVRHAECPVLVVK